MDKKMPKFHILLFADYPLGGRLFGFIAFTLTGLSAFFSKEHYIGLGIVLSTVAVLFTYLFFHRYHFLREIFQNGTPVDAVVQKISVLSMHRGTVTAKMEYSYFFEGEEYASSCVTAIGRSYGPMNEQSAIKILVLRQCPSRPIVQDVFNHANLFFAFIVYLFTGRTGKRKNGRNDKHHH